MIEKDMEDLIASFPDDFFPRRHFVLVGRQQSFSGIGRFDLLFEDEFKSTILMELKARTLKYEDATQVARYRISSPSLGFIKLIRGGDGQLSALARSSARTTRGLCRSGHPSKTLRMLSHSASSGSREAGLPAREYQ